LAGGGPDFGGKNRIFFREMLDFIFQLQVFSNKISLTREAVPKPGWREPLVRGTASWKKAVKCPLFPIKSKVAVPKLKSNRRFFEPKVRWNSLKEL
jgi:hypothetical protein